MATVDGPEPYGRPENSTPFATAPSRSHTSPPQARRNHIMYGCWKAETPPSGPTHDLPPGHRVRRHHRAGLRTGDRRVCLGDRYFTLFSSPNSRRRAVVPNAGAPRSGPAAPRRDRAACSSRSLPCPDRPAHMGRCLERLLQTCRRVDGPRLLAGCHVDAVGGWGGGVMSVVAGRMWSGEGVAMSTEGSDLRIPAPSGCRWCGIDEREHMQRWKPPAGWHEWAPPTLEQRKERMQARRRQRPSGAGGGQATQGRLRTLAP
uniref:Uncharacterized protein n=1 Tax=Streptomyces pratensis (strain ATCC 33331 / IAF-45CD) TaxID=591167 RepID=A0A8D3WQ26_STRFA